MNSPLIWLHEESLRLSHPVFKAAPADARTVYIWDDAYFRRTGHSLKRLVFIYETLSEMPVDIIQGNTVDVIGQLSPSSLYVPAVNNPLISEIVDVLKSAFLVQIVEDDPFVSLSGIADFRRFFQYWNRVKEIVLKG